MPDDEDAVPILWNTKLDCTQKLGAEGVTAARIAIDTFNLVSQVGQPFILCGECDAGDVLEKVGLRQSVSKNAQVRTKCRRPRICKPERIAPCPIPRLTERLAWGAADQNIGITLTQTGSLQKSIT